MIRPTFTLLTTITLLLGILSTSLSYAVLTSDAGWKGERMCCDQKRCGADWVNKVGTSGSDVSSSDAQALSKRDGTGSVPTDLRTVDTCFPAQQAATGAATMYAGASVYTIQATLCGVACFGAGTPAGPALAQACSIAGISAGVVDSLLTFAISRSGEKLVEGLKTSALSIVSGGAGLAANLSSGGAAGGSGGSGGSGGAAAGKQGFKMDWASCLQALAAGAMATGKWVGGRAAADEATRLYALKLETDNSTGQLIDGQQMRGDGVNGGGAAGGGSGDTSQGGQNSFTTTSLAISKTPPVTPGPSKDLAAAKAQFTPQLNELTQKTLGTTPDQIMDTLASGTKPSSLIASLMSPVAGEGGAKMAALSEELANASKLSPEELAKIEPASAIKTPSYGYEAIRSAARSKGNGDDLSSLMAGIMNQFGPKKGQSNGDRTPASNVSYLNNKDPNMAGIHVIPAGDKTTIFDLMNRSYARFSPWLLGMAAQPPASQLTGRLPAHVVNPTTESGDSSVPANPYLQSQHH